MEDSIMYSVLIGAAISVTSLICFFYLCYNVSIMKKMFTNEKKSAIKRAYILYKMEKYQQAHDLLVEAYWDYVYDIADVRMPDIVPEWEAVFAQFDFNDKVNNVFDVKTAKK